MMAKNTILKEWDQASDEERFEFLCGLDKSYQTQHGRGTGLMRVYQKYIKTIQEIKEKDKNA